MVRLITEVRFLTFLLAVIFPLAFLLAPPYRLI
nr:MAG TPA: hypothetical protein [Caudoviricetes sp.]